MQGSLPSRAFLHACPSTSASSRLAFARAERAEFSLWWGHRWHSKTTISNPAPSNNQNAKTQTSSTLPHMQLLSYPRSRMQAILNSDGWSAEYLFSNRNFGRSRIRKERSYLTSILWTNLNLTILSPRAPKLGNIEYI